MLLLSMDYKLMPSSLLVGLCKDPHNHGSSASTAYKNCGGRVYEKNPIQEQTYQHEEEDDDYYKGNLSLLFGQIRSTMLSILYKQSLFQCFCEH